MTRQPRHATAARRARRARATSPSSWTATAAGRRRAACRAPPATAPAPRRRARLLRAAGEAGRRMPDPLRLLVGELAAARGRDQRPDGAAALLHPARARQPSPRRRSASRSSAITRPSRPTLRGWSTRRVAQTAGNDRMTLAIALNYGARAELVQRAPAGRAGRGRSAGPTRSTRRDRGRARHRRSAAARPADPHLGRAAPVQLPALAGGLCRIAVRRHALARFRRRRAARRAGRLCAARAALRRPMSDARTRRPQSDLPTRFAAGVVMIAVAGRRHLVRRLAVPRCSPRPRRR